MWQLKSRKNLSIIKELKNHQWHDFMLDKYTLFEEKIKKKKLE